ncbi:acyl-CoA dehydrogenase [Pyrodictium abyssi]|uniref:Medium-chain specific acyl-CoA dehydrogenase, mitochondrial n=1 Tax=Pyrodictium abyssi TaxID=54256 RepID=A0ABM8IWL9_9CREN|nr:acyl-CoA dehydrogenase family protein [Pyrodictium abyssi]
MGTGSSVAGRVLELAGDCSSLGKLARRVMEARIDPCTGMSLVSHCVSRRILSSLGAEAPQGLLSPALSEPRGGSDLAGVETSAELLGDGRVRITGEKVFATNALYASAILVFARSSEGYVLALVEPGASGLHAEPLDLEAYSCSGVARLRLENVEARLVAGPGREPYLAVLRSLAESRVLVAVLALSLASTVLEKAVDWALSRGVYRFQAVSHRLARAYAGLEAAKALVEKAADTLESGGRLDWALTSAAKYIAVEAGLAAADAAVRTFGGHAARRGTGLSELLLHLYALEPAEGTSDIQLEIIARSLEKQRAARRNTG